MKESQSNKLKDELVLPELLEFVASRHMRDQRTRNYGDMSEIRNARFERLILHLHLGQTSTSRSKVLHAFLISFNKPCDEEGVLSVVGWVGGEGCASISS